MGGEYRPMGDYEDREKNIDRTMTAGIVAGIVLAPFTGGASVVGSLMAAIGGAAAHYNNEQDHGKWD